MVSIVLFSHMMNKNSLLLHMRTNFGGKEFWNKVERQMCLHSQETLWDLETQVRCKPLLCLRQAFESASLPEVPDEFLIYKATLSSISLPNGVSLRLSLRQVLSCPYLQNSPEGLKYKDILLPVTPFLCYMLNNPAVNKSRLSLPNHCH